MKGKFNIDFQIENNTCEITDKCKVDIYIEAINQKAMDCVKYSLMQLCNNIANYIADDIVYKEDKTWY